ncbi:MAG TPA: hypothetical protein VH092_27720, partial [Urbifossiella sp.]|nr:hypothetical protein [Urbifossiella sp.]
MTMDFNPTFCDQFVLAFQLLPDGVKSFIQLFKLCLEYILSMWSLPLEVYCRSRWGVRAMSGLQVGFLIAAALTGRYLGPVAASFLLGSALLGVWHYIE